jgi:hypothetical protein
MKKRLKNILGVFLALTLIFSMLPIFAVATTSETDDDVIEQAEDIPTDEINAETPDEPTENPDDMSEPSDGEAQDDEDVDLEMASLEIMPLNAGFSLVYHTRSDFRIYYGVGNHRTSYYTANGNAAFCLHPNLRGINTGTYAVSRHIQRGTGYDLLIKGAYYLYGGPGYDSVKHNLFTNPDSHTAYAYSHAALAYIFTGDTPNAFMGLSEGERQHLRNVIASVDAQPMPPRGFSIFIYNEGVNRYQAFLGWNYVPAGHLEIRKTSTNPAMSNGSSLYSLQGAVFDVFNGANQRLGSVTTDVNGRGRLNDIDADQTGLYIVEVTPPKGFALNTNRIPFEIVSGQTVTVTISNRPQNDPVGIILRKRDADTSNPTPQGGALLAGAEFTIKYYPELYSTASQLSGLTPTRTWVVRTDSNGIAFLLPNYIVSGDELFFAGNNDPTIPLGTITIQETKAPEGYHINDELFIRQIVSNGVAESVRTYNVPIIPETVMRGGMQIEKWDIERNQTQLKQGDTTLAGAVLDIWNRSANSVVVNGVEYAPNTVVHSMTTNASGWAGTANSLLPYGNYEVVERTPPTGYLNTGIIRQSFQIRQNGVIVDLRTNDTAIKNNVIRGGIEIEKWDIERNLTGIKQGDSTLAVAVFDIWNRSADIVIVGGREFAPNTVVHTMTTNTSGLASTSNNLLPYGSYEIIERTPPTGYLNTGVIRQSFQIRQNGVIVSLRTSDRVIKNNVIRGGVEIEKWDIERNQTQLKQGDTTLAGAVFEIWNRSADSVIVGGVLYAPNTLVHTMTTNTSGLASTSNNLLPYGSYEIIERTPPTGYLNTGVIRQSFQIRQNGVIVSLRTNDTVIKNNIIRGGVYIEKWDNEIGRREPQGNATLEGAVFEIVNRSIDSVIVQSRLYAVGEVVYTMTTDSEGIATTSNSLLPYGTYEVREISPPLRGYLATGVLSRTFHIREHGIIVELNTDDTAIRNNPIRGDLRGVKISGGDAHRMANVPFRITSVTTGESHVIITDINGELNTSSEWNPHSQNTNRGETDRDGIWFGEIETLDDYVGALLFDTYLIEELQCQANEGRELFAFEISVYRHNHVINLGTLTNEYVPTPDIFTTAMDRETMQSSTFVSEETTIIDTIYFSGLQSGRLYTLKGILMDKSTEKPLLIDGEQVTAETTFRAFAESGAVTMNFTFNSLTLGGKSVVVFQYLYQDDTEIVAHADIDDEMQTVTFLAPVIGTTASGINGEKILDIRSEVTIVDKVFYENLIAGETYTVVGRLMDKETNQPLLIDGNEVVSQATFTAKEESGTVNVFFTFSSVSLIGKKVVVFEYLYYGDRLIAVHTDIEDEGQTVVFQTPSIGTVAVGKDGNKIIPLDENAVIIDTVSYENLSAGATYTLVGLLMDKETAEPVLVDGEQVTADITFTAEESSGSVDVVFIFDSTELFGKTLVVFEYLYYEDTLIAEHTDIDDEAQTVTVEDEPPDPETPEPEPTPTPTPNNPQTGQDGLPYWLLAVLMVLLIIAVVLTVYTRKRWKNVPKE